MMRYVIGICVVLAGCSSVAEPECEIFHMEDGKVVATGEYGKCPSVVQVAVSDTTRIEMADAGERVRICAEK